MNHFTFLFWQIQLYFLNEISLAGSMGSRLPSPVTLPPLTGGTRGNIHLYRVRVEQAMCHGAARQFLYGNWRSPGGSGFGRRL